MTCWKANFYKICRNSNGSLHSWTFKWGGSIFHVCNIYLTDKLQCSWMPTGWDKRDDAGSVTQHPTGSHAQCSPSAPSSIINTPWQPSFFLLFFSSFFLAQFRCLPARCHGNGVPATQQPLWWRWPCCATPNSELESINQIHMPRQPS